MVTNDVQKIKFTDDELNIINEHLSVIESMLKNKTMQLSPDESKRFGRLGIENEKWANTVYHDVNVAPQLLPPFIDITKLKEDEKTREQLNTLTDRFKSITELLIDSNQLIGYKIFKKCLVIYKNAQMLCEEGISGVKVYLDKWSTHFERKGRKNKTQTTN
ncbi:MAG: hypothetical protein K9I82_10885 [Chitinophagaceae bacterium]|nr:hypothetical protein [Chitinophagaceae bacterium]